MPLNERERGRLDDMLAAAREARGFLGQVSLEGLKTDSMRLAAIVYKLAVLGEAASRLPEEWRLGHPELPWQQIRGLRNVLIHDYGRIDVEIVYAVLTQNLPGVITTLEHLLEEH